ncbi:DUF4192 domain-containing protein [Nocardioides daphniae]|uniref:DUF4192 domain-containing protein n=1 Tax=Nocardioides daphniae TaxID=402297 RepID=A0A4P7UAG7_9ACTN|nr:DUF4192 domain-containing protein [Nocardioides daphniae]QCC77070.1 DUF4192 domain-containing protein [Nocardioides daphniae]GGD19301.1 hypothetical protein GCM10007231_18030 [Nocardioides daphniae]
MTPDTSITVRTPDDLLACVPLLLGFLPERSAVVVSLPPGAGPHARADVLDETDLADLTHGLLDPLARHRVRRVAVVVYAGLHRAREVGAHLVAALEEAGIEVVAAVAADGGQWLSVVPETSVPREYDALAHPYVVEAVVAGKVVLGSRSAVRDQLFPDPRLCAEVAHHLAGETSPDDPEWLRSCLARHLEQGTLPDAAEVARLQRVVADQDGRDAAWAWVDRADARQHVEMWLRVVRGCVPEERAAPAAILAFHAWLAGDGALAWCAVEASEDAVGACSLTRLVEDLLTRAAPPTLWQPLMAAPEVPRTSEGGRRDSGAA